MLRTLTLCLALFLATPSAFAQVLKVLTAGAMKGVVVALVPGFQNKTGVLVRVVEGDSAALLQRVQDGEAFDILVLPTTALDTLAAAGRVQRASITPLGRLGEAFGHARALSSPLDDAVDVFVNSLNGFTATEVMKLYNIQPLR
jgi:molybdate transport system substrate-binding protein